MLESRTLVIFTFTSAPTTIRGRKYCFPTMKSDNLNCISCFNAMYQVKHPSARRLNHAQMAHFGQNDCKCLEMCNIRQHADARRSAEMQRPRANSDISSRCTHSSQQSRAPTSRGAFVRR